MPYANFQNDGAFPYPVSPGGPGTYELIRDGIDALGSGLVRMHVGSNGIGDIFTTHINGTGNAPTVGAGAGAGAGATVSAQAGHDLAGSFIVTTAGTPAAGTLATVTFNTALPAAPVSVIVTGWDNTSGLDAALGVGSLTANGFNVLCPALTTAHAIFVNYLMIAS